MLAICVFVALLFAYSVFSARLDRLTVTGPIVFVSAGLILASLAPEVNRNQVAISAFLRIAEVGLVLLLFTDASRTDLAVLRNIWSLPTRLLSTGMLLTIVLGGACAKVIFPPISVWEAGILAAILAPTDAGLGQVIVNSPQVPMRIREALNVEAGLNDGISVPFMMFFMALASMASENVHVNFFRYFMEQLGYGVTIGATIGLIGGWAMHVAQDRQWMAKAFEPIGMVSLPLLCVLASDATGASKFIAAFVAGMTVQRRFHDAGKHSVAFAEDWGKVLNFGVFALFGVLVARSWHDFRIAHIAYAIISLTLVRMLPVALALVGTRLNRATVLLMGWFGPRGLASIVLGLVYIEHIQHGLRDIADIRLAVMMTVLISVFAHGLSAGPLLTLYARRIKYLSPDAPEHSAHEYAHRSIAN